MGKEHGYAYQKEVQDSLEYLKQTKYGKNLFWERIADTQSYGAKCQNCNTPFFPNIILPKVPADHRFLIYGKTCYIEEKASRNTTSYNVTYIKPHQLEAGFDIMDAGGQYYFIICKRIPFHMESFALTPNELTEAMKNMENKNSIKWGTLEKYASFKIQRNMKLKIWDVDPIVIRVRNGVK